MQPSLPPYKQIFEGFNISGPIKKNKASFTLDFDRRDITENAFILATTLDSNFNPLTINQGIVTPQTRMTITPRLDYPINDKNTLVAALSEHAHRAGRQRRRQLQSAIPGL